VRPRLRRLVSWWRGTTPAAPEAPPPPVPEPPRENDVDTERRLEDARQRLKQSVPPRDDL
jgi:hypothetical protein